MRGGRKGGSLRPWTLTGGAAAVSFAGLLAVVAPPPLVPPSPPGAGVRGWNPRLLFASSGSGCRSGSGSCSGFGSGSCSGSCSGSGPKKGHARLARSESLRI